MWGPRCAASSHCCRLHGAVLSGTLAPLRPKWRSNLAALCGNRPTCAGMFDCPRISSTKSRQPFRRSFRSFCFANLPSALSASDGSLAAATDSFPFGREGATLRIALFEFGTPSAGVVLSALRFLLSPPPCASPPSGAPASQGVPSLARQRRSPSLPGPPVRHWYRLLLGVQRGARGRRSADEFVHLARRTVGVSRDAHSWSSKRYASTMLHTIRVRHRLLAVGGLA